VQQIMREIIEQEGPIEFSRLCKLTAGVFGLTKVNSNREATLRSVIPKEVDKTPGEGFAWPENINPDNWSGFRVSEDFAQRPLEVISKREICNAMAHHASRALGMDREDLFRETLQTFGGRRMTPGIEELLESALQWGIGTGRIRLTDSGHYLGDS